jgi:hypothetical protein
MTDSTNLTTTSDQLPEYLKTAKVTSVDNFDNSDVAIPKIKLLQGGSKELETFDYAKLGQFWHTGADMLLGNELNFVVCARRKKYLLTAPMDDGQGILARSDDASKWDRIGEWDVKLKGQKTPVKWRINDLDVKKSGLTDWGSSDPSDSNSPPAATLFYDYLVILPDFPELGASVLTLGRSQIKKAKKGLNDKISMQGGAGRPMQSLVFRAKVVNDKNTSGQEYKGFQFSQNGFAQKTLYEKALEYAPLITSMKITDEAYNDEDKTNSKVSQEDEDMPF